jgi:hypothetical protein
MPVYQYPNPTAKTVQKMQKSQLPNRYLATFAPWHKTLAQAKRLSPNFTTSDHGQIPRSPWTHHHGHLQLSRHWNPFENLSWMAHRTLLDEIPRLRRSSKSTSWPDFRKNAQIVSEYAMCLDQPTTPWDDNLAKYLCAAWTGRGSSLFLSPSSTINKCRMP